MSDEDDSMMEEQPEQEEQSEEHSEPEIEVVSGPFAVLIKTLDCLDTAWDHAVNKDDFEKMMMVVDKTLDVNDRYMAVHMTQEDNSERIERGHPEQFGFSAEINNSPRPPDVKSR